MSQNTLNEMLEEMLRFYYDVGGPAADPLLMRNFKLSDTYKNCCQVIKQEALQRCTKEEIQLQSVVLQKIMHLNAAAQTARFEQEKHPNKFYRKLFYYRYYKTVRNAVMYLNPKHNKVAAN